MTATSAAGAPMVATLAETFRRAWRSGDPAADTEHLLEELAGRLPSLRAALEPYRYALEANVGADAGSSEQTAADVPLTEVGFEATATLAETAWLVRRERRPAARAGEPAFTTGVRAAVGEALMVAADAGAARAHAMHLLVGVLSDDTNRASALLARCGIDKEELCRQLPLATSVRHSARPYAPTVDALALVGALDIRSPAWSRLARFAGRVLAPRSSTGPVVDFLEHEAIRQAVRTGSTQVGPAHLLVAIAAVQWQLDATGRRIADRYAPFNQAGAVLTGCGVPAGAAARWLAGHGQPTTAAATTRHRPWRNMSADPAFGEDAAEPVDRARDTAAALHHPYVGSTHLLLAVLADPDGAARRLLAGLEVDAERVAAEARSRLP